MKARIEVQKREDGLRVVVNGIEVGPFISTFYTQYDYLQPVLADLCCALFDRAYRLGAESVRQELRDIIDAEF